MRVLLLTLVACRVGYAPVATPADAPAQRATCRLPELPAALGPAVGYPDESHVALSKGDWAVLADYLEIERRWIEAAAICLAKQ